MEGFGGFAGAGFDLDAVVEEAVYGFVVVVEAAGGFVGFGAELVEGLADLGGAVALGGEVAGEVDCFDVAVGLACGFGAILPVAEVVVAELIFEEGDHTVLGDAFGVSDVAHGGAGGGGAFGRESYYGGILGIRQALSGEFKWTQRLNGKTRCIMPCLSGAWRVWFRGWRFRCPCRRGWWRFSYFLR